MRFFETVLAGAAFVAAALALEINDFPSNPQAGQTYTVTYSPADNTPTTFILRKGVSTNLGTVATLTTTATGGKFQWTVDKSLADGTDYALQIQQAGVDPNYSKQFPITGGAAASASASASSASASAASSASSSIASALSSAISSALSSASSAASVSAASTLTTAASGAPSSSAGTNSTISSATLSATKTGASATGGSKATGSSTASGGAPSSTNAAGVLGSSPLALIFGAVAAIAYVH